MTTSEHEDDPRWLTALSRARPQLSRDMRSRPEDDELCAAAVASALAATTGVAAVSTTPLFKSTYAWLTAVTGAVCATALTLWLTAPESAEVGEAPPVMRQPAAPGPTQAQPRLAQPAAELPALQPTAVDVSPEPEQTRPPSRPRVSRKAPAPAPAPDPSATAASVFGAANAARRAGEYADAVAHYRRLQREWPTSREAKISRLALGRLLLERMGQPADALAQFEAYLQRNPAGASAEDALVGRARALQKLGRSDAERTAWQRVLAKYPGSVHAARARKRVEDPGPP